MNTNNSERLELDLWKHLASRHLSVSHDRWHIDEVLRYARELHTIYGGDIEVLTAAVVLHDLGRTEPTLRGQASTDRSIQWARPILEDIGFPADKIEAVLTAIREHDKPEVSPSTVEGRILKDADFLAGFGAWGVLRTAMWAGETGGGMRQIMDRFQKRMPERLAHLEFLESVRLARQATLFTNLFLAQLFRNDSLAEVQYPGKYIVLEGISGSGKDTQARELRDKLQSQGYDVLTIHEPHNPYYQMKDALNETGDPGLRKFLFMADRYELVQKKIIPALKMNQIVISVRSYVSTLVYQCATDHEVAAIAFIHRFVPNIDLLLLYDLAPSVAMSRIEQRHKEKGKRIGDHEKLELLRRNRDRYHRVIQNMPGLPYKIIDANASIKDIADESWLAVANRVLERTV